MGKKRGSRWSRWQKLGTKDFPEWRLPRTASEATRDHDCSLIIWCSDYLEFFCKNSCIGTSLVAQWLRIHLPMQGTRVRSLVLEDPTCRGATKPMCHNYWTCALEPVSHNYWARVPQLLKPARLEPVLQNKRSCRNETPAHRNEE